MESDWDPGWAEDAQRQWRAGRCPCCSCELTEHPGEDGPVAPRAVAEGVVLCGRCIANNHDADDVLPDLLMMLVADL